MTALSGPTHIHYRNPFTVCGDRIIQDWPITGFYTVVSSSLPNALLVTSLLEKFKMDRGLLQEVSKHLLEAKSPQGEQPLCYSFSPSLKVSPAGRGSRTTGAAMFSKLWLRTWKNEAGIAVNLVKSRKPKANPGDQEKQEAWRLRTVQLI